MYFEWSGLEPARRHTTHIGHGQHLCDMAEKGEVSLEQMKVLVKNAIRLRIFHLPFLQLRIIKLPLIPFRAATWRFPVFSVIKNIKRRMD